MAKVKVRPEFRSKLSEKLMDLGNIVGGALVFGQFVSGREFSESAFSAGIVVMASCYLISYIISS